MEKSKIKVLQITVRADFGGGPEHLYRLITNLSGNCEIYVAAPEDYPYFERYIKAIGEEHIVRIPHRKFTINAFMTLYNFVKINKISVIHSHGKGAGVYSRVLSLFLRIKCIHTFHGFHIGEYNKFQLYFYLLMERFFSKFTDYIITVSGGEKQELLEKNIAAENKLLVINNGVEPAPRKVDETVHSDKKKRVISFTRFDYQKNSEMLFEIFNELIRLGKDDQYEFHLLGEGSGLEDFRKKVHDNSLQNKIIIHGAVSNPIDYLIEGFCYISTSRWEGLPLSLLEAMSVGLPVIATDVVGNNDIIEHNIDGYLFPLSLPEECAKHLLELSEDYNKWLNFSNLSAQKVQENFSTKEMAIKVERLYLI